MRKKILVIRHRFIGDTVLTVPFLRNLRHACPDTQIDMLIAPNTGDIIKNCPYIDNFIYYDLNKKYRYEGVGINNSEISSFWGYIKFLRKQKYDKVYILKRSFSSAVMAFAAGIKERIGFGTEFRSFLLTKSVPYIENKHEIECFLDVLRADNIEVKDNYLENWCTEEEFEKVEKVFEKYNLKNSNNKKIILHATSGNPKKQWETEKWAKIVQWLSDEKDAQVIFNGAKQDYAVYDKILSHLEENGNKLKIKPANLCGEFSIRETLAFTKMCDLIAGCDSGNLHIAASVGVPVIGIYGPMNTIKWRAWEDNSVVIKTDLPCQPCGLKKACKRDFQCIKDISVNQVKEEIEKLLEKI